MSILIPGKMPTRCWDCPMCYDMMACTITGLNWYRDTVDLSIDPVEERMPNCPLIELPPHGRLGDLDALAAKDNADYEDAMASIADVSTRSMVCQLHYGAQKMIRDAPTIIPAEGDADNG